MSKAKRHWLVSVIIFWLTIKVGVHLGFIIYSQPVLAAITFVLAGFCLAGGYIFSQDKKGERQADSPSAQGAKAPYPFKKPTRL